MKKFYRLRDKKFLFGLCSGLGDYFKIDPVIFRIIFIGLTIGYPGIGIGLYVISCLITPLADSEST